MFVPSLIFDKNRFIFQCKFEERELAKQSGLRWDGVKKIWYTPDLKVAARLREYASGEAKNRLSKNLITTKPWALPLPSPPEGLSLLPHQEIAIRFALERNRCYLALDPRLGKTICAAIISLALRKPVVYICPPFLVENVRQEFRRWAPEIAASIFIVRDSMLTNKHICDLVRSCAEKNPKTILFVDEAHRFKNENAQRTQALFGGRTNPSGLVDYFERRIYLSGSPMPNRPIELFAVLSKEAPETIDFKSRFSFGVKYCAGHKNEFGKWDFGGASNLDELSRRVCHPSGPFMLRQRRSLLQLPPKIEEVFTVSTQMSPRLSDFNQQLVGRYSDIEDLIKKQIAASAKVGEDELHLGTYRRLLGLEKLPAACDYINSIVEDSDENILVYAFHKEVIAGLMSRLSGHYPLVIKGETPVNDRHNIVKTFEEEKSRRLLIGNYLAMGVGFTIPKANRVIFVEFDWSPGVNEQASDRPVHLNKKESVLVQYVAMKDSVDRLVIETLLRKRRNLKHI